MQKYWDIQTNMEDNPNQAEHTISKEANANREIVTGISELFGITIEKRGDKNCKKKRETNGMVMSQSVYLTVRN